MLAIVKEAVVKVAKNNKPYLDIKLTREGGDEIAGKMWDFGGEAPAAGQVLEITGDEKPFNGKPQIDIRSMRPVPTTADVLAKFLEKTTYDVDKLWENIQFVIEKEMSGFPQDIVRDAMKLYGEEFKQAPAAKNMHHNWIGGLLEHVSEMCSIWRKTQEHFPGVDPNKVFFGIILHDFCKVFEYDWKKGFIDFSGSGRLVGHIPKSIQMLTRIMDNSQVPDDLQDELLHIVSSHHGKLEWGSPQAPATAEALMVHWIDNWHGTMIGCLKHIEKTRKANPDAKWTEPHFLIEKARFLVPEPAPVIEEDAEEIPF